MRSRFRVADGPSTNDTVTLFFAVENDTSLEGWRPDPFRIMEHCAQRYVSPCKAGRVYTKLYIIISYAYRILQHAPARQQLPLGIP